VVDRVDDVGLDGQSGEREVPRDREEARVDQVGGQPDLAGHPVDVLEVLGQHHDHLVVGTPQRGLAVERLLEVGRHGVVERRARAEDREERQHVRHQAVDLRALQRGAFEDRAAHHGVVVLVAVDVERSHVHHDQRRGPRRGEGASKRAVVASYECRVLR
jgi:hypothetical protein